MDKKTICYIEEWVRKTVENCEVVDVHTHLFPDTHGSLMLWGIDELLTYHYLVAEYFQTAPMKILPEQFFLMQKCEQADLIWQHLFIDRLPISEAARGVVSVLVRLGLQHEMEAHDLQGIREWFRLQDPSSHVERVFQLAKVKYVVMTNIPFSEEEAQHWKPNPAPYSNRFRSALRCDPLLAADWASVSAELLKHGYEESATGARAYLNSWIDTMNPEYLMASTPHDFKMDQSDPLACFTQCSCMTTSLLAEDINAPFSFAKHLRQHLLPNCPTSEITKTVNKKRKTDKTADNGNNDVAGSELLEKVLIPVAVQRNLPIALKIGAHRKVNAELESGGDGLVTVDLSDLRILLHRYPHVKFLVTLLSKTNQHEACVLANKFRNLHLYGCWWYCNLPSIIREVTSMRLELLGFTFTAQHSDARVLEHLIYKWDHARAVIADVLVENFTKLAESGWPLSQGQVKQEVERLLGGAYHDFMTK